MEASRSVTWNNDGMFSGASLLRLMSNTAIQTPPEIPNPAVPDPGPGPTPLPDPSPDPVPNPVPPPDPEPNPIPPPDLPPEINPGVPSRLFAAPV